MSLTLTSVHCSQYKDETKYVDVTDRYKLKLIDNSIKFSGKFTEEIGYDPFPGIVKKLKVLYQIGNSAVKLKYFEENKPSVLHGEENNNGPSPSYANLWNGALTSEQAEQYTYDYAMICKIHDKDGDLSATMQEQYKQIISAMKFAGLKLKEYYAMDESILI